MNLLIRKLAGEASPAEQEEMDMLLAGHPDFLQTCRLTEDFWKKNSPGDPEFLEATWLLHLMRLKEKGHLLQNPEEQPAPAAPRLRRMAWLFSVPAVALLMIIFTRYQGRPAGTDAPTAAALPAPVKVEVSTKNGDHSKIQLPDGSQVWLNAGSKLDYDKSFGGELREVYLNGEAFFDVVRNEKLPFIVHTATADIKVLGTAFNVRSYNTDATTETSLIRGSVEVLDKNSSEKWLLKPNQKLVLQNSAVQLKASIATRSISAGKAPPVAEIKKLTIDPAANVPLETVWIDDKLYLAEEPFSEVAKKLERRYDVNFEFSNSRSEKMMIHGIFYRETLQQALDALQFSFGFSYTIVDKTVIIN